MSEKVYVGDIGTIIEIDMQENISTATDQRLDIKKPDGTETVWTVTIYNSTYLRHTIATLELDLKGVYHIQPYMKIGTWTGRGNTVNLTVHDHFE